MSKTNRNNPKIILKRCDTRKGISVPPEKNIVSEISNCNVRDFTLRSDFLREQRVNNKLHSSVTNPGNTTLKSSSRPVSNINKTNTADFSVVVGKSCQVLLTDVKSITEKTPVDVSNKNIKLTTADVPVNSIIIGERKKAPRRGASGDLVRSSKILIQKCDKQENRGLSGKHCKPWANSTNDSNKLTDISLKTMKKAKKKSNVSRIKKLMYLIKGPKIVLEKCDKVKNWKVLNKYPPLEIPNNTSSYPSTAIKREVIEEEAEVIVVGEKNFRAAIRRNNSKGGTCGFYDKSTNSANDRLDIFSFPTEVNAIKVEAQIEATSKESLNLCTSKTLRSGNEVKSTIAQGKSKALKTVHYNIPDAPVAEIHSEETEEQGQIILGKNSPTSIGRKPEKFLKTFNIKMVNGRTLNENAKLPPSCDSSVNYPVVVKLENDSETYSVTEDDVRETLSQHLSFETCNIGMEDMHTSYGNTDTQHTTVTSNCHPVVVKIEDDSEYENGEINSIIEDDITETMSRNLNFDNIQINSRPNVDFPSKESSGEVTLCTDAIIKLENQNQIEEELDVTQELVGHYSEDSHDIQSLSTRVKREREETNDYLGTGNNSTEGTEIRSLSCPCCSAKFITKSSLKSHLVSHSGKKLYTCSNCSSNFGLKINFEEHLRKCLPCTDQSVTMHPSKVSKETAKFCSKQKLHTCSQCSKNFSLKMNLMRHMETHASSKLLSCSFCPAEFYSNNNLEAHMKRHRNNVNFNMSEHLGDNIFSPKRRMGTQSNEKRLTRSSVSATCEKKSQPLKHTTSDKSTKLFMCTYCSATFKSKQGLKYHEVIHTREDSFSCKYCSAKFIQESNLKTHLKIHMNLKPFTCSECPAKFRQKIQLKNHSMLHTGERPFSCSQCSSKFIQKVHLQIHLKKHFSDEKQQNGQKPLFCTYCSLNFKSAKALQDHSNVHCANKRIPCVYCSAKFLSESSLRTHLTKFHQKKDLSLGSTKKSVPIRSQGESEQPRKLKKNKKACAKVNLSSTSKQKSSLQNLRKSKGEKRFQCAQCSHNFHQEGRLKVHMREHAVSNESQKKRTLIKPEAAKKTDNRPFCCPRCPVKFFQKVQLEKHSKKHTNPLSCGYCSKNFTSMQAVCAHSKTHSREKPFLCTYCFTGFSSKIRLQAHSKKHTNKLSSRIPASVKVCNLGTSKKSRKLQKSGKPLSSTRSNQKPQLQNNIKMSKGKKLFPCSRCSLHFCRKTSLTSHMQKHTNLSKTQTQKKKQLKMKTLLTQKYCTADLPSKFALKRHTMSHTGERPFCCPRCPSKFFTKWHLQRHTMSHTGERPFCCPRCPAKFTTKSHLQRHIMSHTGERPFCCPRCSAKFTTKYHLHKHQLTHSKKKSLLCKYCSAKFMQKARLQAHLAKHVTNEKKRPN